MAKSSTVRVEEREVLRMYSFSPITLERLEAAGWTEEYRFDASEYELLLRREGYHVFPIVVEFLSRFGGLRIGRPSWRLKGSIHWFHFQVDTVVSRSFKGNIEADMKDIQTPLCLIGDAYDNQMLIVMDPDGRVYVSFQGLHDLGVSGEDAIEALCVNRAIKGFAEDHL